jgi:hypothetical protein
MYLQVFFPIVITTIYFGSKKYLEKKNNIDELDEFEYIESDYKSCPLIIFDKNGNYYYVYE